MTQPKQKSLELSVVIPVMNEEGNIEKLVKAIKLALAELDYEIIFVDDGSVDDTVLKIQKLKDKNIKLLRFTRNFGQSSAIAAGIDHAKGKYIATIDGDLQNDPSDIPMMLAKLKSEKLDLLSGIRAKRKDGMILRKIPSIIANFLIRTLTKVNISDYGCTLKIFKANVAKNLELYGELHRFIPILATIGGAKIGEVAVKHHKRNAGISKYGLSRTSKVISDLLLMLFFVKYRQKPGHLFGGIGVLLMLISGLISSYLVVLKLMGYDIGQRPLFYVDLVFIIAALQFFSVGFLAELMMRTYFEASNKKPYNIVDEE
jgi:glycosyltransferase involved in cell wall biosynthesis